MSDRIDKWLVDNGYNDNGGEFHFKTTHLAAMLRAYDAEMQTWQFLKGCSDREIGRSWLNEQVSAYPSVLEYALDFEQVLTIISCYQRGLEAALKSQIEITNTERLLKATAEAAIAAAKRDSERLEWVITTAAQCHMAYNADGWIPSVSYRVIDRDGEPARDFSIAKTHREAIDAAMAKEGK